MAGNDKEIQKNNGNTASQEHADERRRFLTPDTDIFEDGDNIYLVADMPGVDKKSVDIAVEKNILTIKGYVEPTAHDGHKVTFREYGSSDYRRSFRLSDDIDNDKIEASMENGVLRVLLPKSGPARIRKIPVLTG